MWIYRAPGYRIHISKLTKELVQNVPKFVVEEQWDQKSIGCIELTDDEYTKQIVYRSFGDLDACIVLAKVGELIINLLLKEPQYEYHLLKCFNPEGDTCFHDQVLLFDVSTKRYKITHDNVDYYYLSAEEMRLNNYVETNYHLDEYFFNQEFEQLRSDSSMYDYIYQHPEYSYFSKDYNSYPYSPDHDLPF